MRIKDLGRNPKWKITKTDLADLAEDDCIYLEIDGGPILIKKRAIIDRYERGIGIERPSVDWVKNGKHESWDGDTAIPEWIRRINLDLSLIYEQGAAFNDYVARPHQVGDQIVHQVFGKGLVVAKRGQNIHVFFVSQEIKNLRN